MSRSLILTILLCASVRAEVHRIGVVHHQQHLNSNDRGSSSQLAEKRIALLTNGVATKEPFAWADYTILGNVSLGSPAQAFSLNFDFFSPNLYVVDVNAVYYDSRNASNTVNVSGKQTYNSSASSSFAAVDDNFSYNILYKNGSVVRDVLLVGDSMQANVTFEDTTRVNSRLQEYPCDGTFGLSNVPAKNATTTLLGQLQSSLDSPDYTLTLDGCPGFVNCTGQITLGGLAPDTCQSDSWSALTTADAVSASATLPDFNITSLSTTAVGDNSGCGYRVDIPMRVIVWTDFDPIFASYQVRELFVQASNASYNSSTGRYELTDDHLALAQPVQLNLANGNGVLQLNPEDYTMLNNKTGMHYLNIYAYYDARERSQPIISLSMQFLTHYCLSKNFQNGVWSLGSRV